MFHLILNWQNGQNALHTVANYGNLEVAKYLLPLYGEKKFDKDNYGCTCLDVASNEQNQDVIDYFLQEGGFPTYLQQVSRVFLFEL